MKTRTMGSLVAMLVALTVVLCGCGGEQTSPTAGEQPAGSENVMWCLPDFVGLTPQEVVKTWGEADDVADDGQGLAYTYFAPDYVYEGVKRSAAGLHITFKKAADGAYILETVSAIYQLPGVGELLSVPVGTDMPPLFAVQTKIQPQQGTEMINGVEYTKDVWNEPVEGIKCLEIIWAEQNVTNWQLLAIYALYATE